MHVYHASDTLSSHQVSAHLRRVLWALPSNKCGEMLGKLPLFIGMRVMITENLSINNGIVNGAEGTVEGIKYHTDESGSLSAGRHLLQQVPDHWISHQAKANPADGLRKVGHVISG